MDADLRALLVEANLSHFEDKFVEVGYDDEAGWILSMTPDEQATMEATLRAAPVNMNNGEIERWRLVLQRRRDELNAAQMMEAAQEVSCAAQRFLSLGGTPTALQELVRQVPVAGAALLDAGLNGGSSAEGDAIEAGSVKSEEEEEQEEEMEVPVEEDNEDEAHEDDDGAVAAASLPPWYSPTKFAELLHMMSMRPNGINDRIYRAEQTAETQFAFAGVTFEEWKELEQRDGGIEDQANNSGSALCLHFKRLGRRGVGNELATAFAAQEERPTRKRERSSTALVPYGR